MSNIVKTFLILVNLQKSSKEDLPPTPSDDEEDDDGDYDDDKDR